MEKVKEETDLFVEFIGKYLPHQLATPERFFGIVYVIFLIIGFLLRLKMQQPLAIGQDMYVIISKLKFLSVNGVEVTAVLPLILLILGGSAFFLFNQLLKEIKVSTNVRSFSLLLFAFFPGYIYAFTGINNTAILFLVTLILMYTLFSEIPPKKVGFKKLLPYIPYICFVILALSDLFIAVIVMITLLLYWKQGSYRSGREQTIKRCIIFSFTLLAGIIIFRILSDGISFIDELFAPQGILSSATPYRLLLTDFNAKFGMSLFFLILVSIGFILLWSKKKAEKGFWFVFLLFGGAYLYSNVGYLVFIAAFLIPLAAYGFNALFHREWKLTVIRDFSLLLIFLGIIFTTTAFLARYPQLEPQSNLLDVLSLLNEETQGEQNTSLLTHPKYNAYVNAITKHSLVADAEAREQMLHARRLDTLIPLLGKYNVKYILITREMKEGLVWSENVQLLFLLGHSENFKKRFENSGVEIWEYKQ